MVRSGFCALALLLASTSPAGAAESSAPQGKLVAQRAPKGAAPSAQAPGRAKKELVRRTLTITDADLNSVSELHVAEGVPTNLTFQLPIRDGGVLLADPQGSFYPPQVMEKLVLIVPKGPMDPHALTTLTVTLDDGTILPFRLVSHASEADVQVDVVLQLRERVTPDSPVALKAANAQLRAQLDDCQATQGRAGIRNVAALLAAQDAEKPQTFIVERREVRALDKQSRLLVQVRQVYRLFDYTYVVITAENRDPTKSWMLDRPEVRVSGSGEAVDAKVEAFVSEFNSLPPGEMQRIVVAFKTPEQQTGQSYTVALFEKNGNRHVQLENLSL